jgi:transcriptional regulator with XRE-family HTH domain
MVAYKPRMRAVVSTSNGMSPRSFASPASPAASAALGRFWSALGGQLREARTTRRWTVETLARRAGVSVRVVYLMEAGRAVSAEAAVRLVTALGLRLEMELIDPRRRDRPQRTTDWVHSAMGEVEARHLRELGYPVGLDEPYQHYQFAGRADVVAWDPTERALLHIENRTRFPNFQDMAGAYNAKRAYLGAGLAERVGISRWVSETHVIAALWSSEVLHAIRLRPESFRSLCPDGPDAFAAWWARRPPSSGTTSTLVIIDPLAAGRQRPFIGLDEVGLARPRYRGYAEVVAKLTAQAGSN